MAKQKGILSDEELEASGTVNNWTLPSLNRPGKIVHSAKREGEERAKELVEHVSRSGRPRNLTANEINDITKAAEEEGFKLGYEEGFAKGEIQGEKKGRSEGEALAYKESKEKLQDEYARLTAICERLLEPLQEQDQALEQTILDLILHFASRLLQKHIEASPEDLLSLIQKAIQALPAGVTNMTIYLHADDARLLEKYLDGKSKQLPLQVDENLARGGCRVETRESIVDYSVEKRWLAMLTEVESSTEPLNTDSEDAP